MAEGLPPIIPSAAPAFPGAPTAAPASFAPPAMPGAPQRPPGRPSSDDEKDAARLAKHATKQRLDKALPARATDEKIRVFRLKKGRVIPGAKPVVEIMISEMEKAIEASGDPDFDRDQYIEDKVLEKFPDTRDVFQCQVFSREGARLPGYSPWDLDFREGTEDADGEGDSDGDDGYDEGMDPGAVYPAGMRMPPPPPAVEDPARIAAAISSSREDEAKRSNETLSAIAQLTSGLQNAQAQASASMNQIFMVMMQQSQQAQERAAKDAADREERDRVRRAESRSMILGLVPVLLPMIQRMLGLDRQGLDPSTQALIEVMKEQIRAANDKKEDPVATIMAVIPQMMQFQTTLAQGSMQQTMNMQNEANKMIFAQLSESLKKESQPAEKSTMETIAEVVGAVAPALAAMAPAQAPAPAPAPALPPPTPASAAPAPVPARRRAAVVTPAASDAPAAPAASPAPHQPNPGVVRQSPLSRIRSCLHAIRRLSVGEIASDHRWEVLRQVAETMPADLRQAVQAGNDNAIMQLGSRVVLSDPALLRWIQVDHYAGFLKEALADVKTLLDNRLTPEMAEVAINQNKAFLRDHPVQAPAASAQAATAPASAPAASPEAAPPVTETTPPPAAAAEAPAAAPAAPTATTPPADKPPVA